MLLRFSSTGLISDGPRLVHHIKACGARMIRKSYPTSRRYGEAKRRLYGITKRKWKDHRDCQVKRIGPRLTVVIRAMDPCAHPTMTHLVGFLSGHGKGPGPSKELFPVMAMCKTTLHPDILAVRPALNQKLSV